MFYSDLMICSHFIAQTSKFLLIDVTAVTLGQGHRRVIQYISPDPYIYVPNISGLAQTVLTWETKVVVAAVVDAAAVANAVETKWKHKVTPDWLNELVNAELNTSLKYKYH